MTNKTLYHGSPYSFAQFNTSSSGIHFGTHDQAAHAACLKLSRIPLKDFEKLAEVKGWRGTIYKCQIKLINTKRLKDPRTPQAWSRKIKKAKMEGYDSIVYSNEYEGSKRNDSYCIFSPEQVVSMENLVIV